MSQFLQKIWNRSTVEDCKQTVKSELEQVQLSSGKTARLEYILEQIQSLDGVTKPEKMQRRFILTVSALYHHVRFEGLSRKQISDLSLLGQSILKASGIRVGRSALAFLYTELHGAMSEIYYSQGEFLRSMWERLLASEAADLPKEHVPYQNLGMAVCALRLGNCQLAIHFFETALAGTTDAGLQDRIRIHLIKARRISGEAQRTHELIQSFEPSMSDPSSLKELVWEKACLAIGKSSDLSEIFALSARGKSHNSTSFILEMYLWAAAHQEMRWLKNMPKLATLLKQKQFDFSSYNALYSFVKLLEQAYDKNIPPYVKITEIKKILPKLAQIPHVDQELLVWLALSRWQLRSRSYAMAAIFFREYESLSWKLSSGRTSDVLSLAEDLYKIDWEKRAS